MKQTLKKLTGLQANIAADVWPDGGQLRCGKCECVKPFTTEDAARYLARGWPMCCGRTMTVETAISVEVEA